MIMDNAEKNICPCCEEHEHTTPIGWHSICPICGWEDDNLQRVKPDYKGGANDNSLNESRVIYKSQNKRLISAT